MHVVAEIRRDEAIARDAVVGQVAREFGVRANVIGAVERVEVDVVEIDVLIVISRIESGAGRRAIRAIDVFLIGLPGNAGVLELNDDVVRGPDMMRGRIVAVVDAEIRAGFEPEVLRQAA